MKTHPINITFQSPCNIPQAPSHFADNKFLCLLSQNGNIDLQIVHLSHQSHRHTRGWVSNIAFYRVLTLAASSSIVVHILAEVPRWDINSSVLDPQLSMDWKISTKLITLWAESTRWSLGDLDLILKMSLSILLHRLVSTNILMIIPLYECHGNLWVTDKCTLVQVMAWCHQGTSHYLSQCWHSSMSPYHVTRPHWVNW